MIEKYRSRKIRVEFRRILMEQWDPIGVNGIPEAWDEYDRYIGGVFGLLSRNALEEEIVQYLHHVETEYMGLGQTDTRRLTPIAKSLREAFTRLASER